MAWPIPTLSCTSCREPARYHMAWPSLQARHTGPGGHPGLPAQGLSSPVCPQPLSSLTGKGLARDEGHPEVIVLQGAGLRPFLQPRNLGSGAAKGQERSRCPQNALHLLEHLQWLRGAGRGPPPPPILSLNQTLFLTQ